MENNPKRIPAARRDPAHTVPHVPSIKSLRSANGTRPRREHEQTSLLESHGLADGLRPGSLLHEQELATVEIDAGTIEQHGKSTALPHGSVEVAVEFAGDFQPHLQGGVGRPTAGEYPIQ